MGDTLRRKLAIASWRSPTEPNIYGKLTLDATEALAYLRDVRERTGEKVTITHLVGRAVGEALAAEPSLNGTIRFGRYVPHDEVAVAFLVTMPDGSDLGKVKVTDIDRRSVVEIARELSQHASRLRHGGDPDWERSKSLVRLLPTWLLRPVVWLTGWLTSAVGVDAPSVGLGRFPFGSAIITNVGVFGLDEGFVPPTPFARVPLYVLIGAVREQPAVVGGEVIARPTVTITATIDHRFIDGFQGGTLAQTVRKVFADPWSLDHLPGSPPIAPAGAAPPSRVTVRRSRP